MPAQPTVPPPNLEASYVPGLAGIPATRSNISFVDGAQGILEYRGISIEELASHSTFLETAYLLIFGYLPTHPQLHQFETEVNQQRRVKYPIRDMIKCFPDRGHPMDALQACVAGLGLFYPLGEEQLTDERYAREATVNLIAKLPTLVAMFHQMRQGNDPVPPRDDLGHSANFLYMLTGQVPDPRVARIFDVCLILHAEHTVNASTFGALVTASTLADPYTVITAAIGALSGPLHGGANEEALQMFKQIGEADHARTFIEGRLARKEKIMGLGHRVYRTKDPRAVVLQQLVGEMFKIHSPSPFYLTAQAVEAVCVEQLGGKGIYPNVDFYSGLVYEQMGIPTDIFTPVFAMARVAGWLAHWRMQLSDNRIFRPTQIYHGPRDVTYTPLTQRGE
ncbi:citrate synthase [Candidatus Cyanaurora vandensis]|uniref:citrate synthase n=1 Tax=Candidatus Cyanaurora vandensis TaxID=2714958 RepID=UPI0037C1B45C